ncbi:MAG: glycosyl hydrolase family 8 [Deltaproteobacteria bacterium]|nr:glycosyl hydrolase family 8 [Deltaproteobacteria bacterium]
MNLCKTAPILLLSFMLLTLEACGERQLSRQTVERVLRASWQSYRQQFISPAGRVQIPERDGGTISEAQAYALLRAVWAADAATFARVYAWTQANLSRPDHLLAWQWGRRADGSWGVLDANTASDGDLDYALALVLAAARGWRAPPGLPDYQSEARQARAAIWKKEVVALPAGARILTPGNWHEAEPPYLLNPSYFSPAAYHLFAKLYGEQPPPAVPGQARAPALHSSSPLRWQGRGWGESVGTVLEPAWDRLHQDTYRLLASLNEGLDNPGVGLFPDWCRIDAQGLLSQATGRETRFGWEAVRLPWRLALDHLWFKEPLAAQILGQKFLPFFRQEWQSRGKLPALYNFAGTLAADYESPVLYAGVLAAALVAEDRDFARQMAEKIFSFYHEKDGRAYFVSPDNYYANNWAWLGLALYAGWVKP